MIKILGNPQSKSRDNCGPGYGFEWLIYKWPSKGIEVSISSEDKEVLAIQISSKSTAKTSRGVGIGSTKDEVKKAYGENEYGNENEWILEDESDTIISFMFLRNKVTSIALYTLFCE